MIYETFMIDSNEGWWLDSGATCHVTPHKNLFKTYKEVKEETKLYMENSATNNILGCDSVDLQLSSEKILSLKNVLHVPGIRKSLISIFLLSHHGIRVVFETDKVILTNNGTFIGKGYAKHKMYLLSTMNENIMSSSYVCDLNYNFMHSYYVCDLNDIWH